MTRALTLTRRDWPLQPATGGTWRDPREQADRWTYSPELAASIAQHLAEGVSLPEQAAAWPDLVPPTTVLAAWKRERPAFALLLRQAEQVRAELLVEQALQLADKAPGAAPRVALMVAQRMAMAERMDRQRWGRSGSDSGGVAALAADAQPVAAELTDAQLAAIAASGVESVGVRGGDPETVGDGV